MLAKHVQCIQNTCTCMDLYTGLISYCQEHENQLKQVEASRETCHFSTSVSAFLWFDILCKFIPVGLFADVSSISPIAGSRMGGQIVTIIGRFFTNAIANVAVSISGKVSSLLPIFITVCM